MSLLQLFDPSLLGRADTPALEFDRADAPRYACTFGELEARSNRLAHVLRARGLGRGDRLAFFLGNRVEIIDLWLAGVKLGLILVPINVLYRERGCAILAPPARRLRARTRGVYPAGVRFGIPISSRLTGGAARRPFHHRLRRGRRCRRHFGHDRPRRAPC